MNSNWMKCLTLDETTKLGQINKWRSKLNIIRTTYELANEEKTKHKVLFESHTIRAQLLLVMLIKPISLSSDHEIWQL